MKKTACWLGIVLLLLTASLFAEGQKEQAFPSAGKTVSILVPYSAGGGTDQMARIMAPFIEKELGATTVVVNKPGAAGEVGMAEMNKSAADGYNLGLLGFPDNYSMASYKKVSFDNNKFEYLASFTETPTILVAKKGSPYSTLKEFIDYAKANPGKMTISESGDSHTITTVLLEEAAGVKMTTVNYDGAGENFNAVLGGHVDAGVLALLFGKRAADQGCKILAVAAASRAPAFPDVPTFKELGYDIKVLSSRVLTVPKGTPQPIVDKLRAVLDNVGKSKEIIDSVNKSGEIYAYRSGRDLESFVAENRDTVVRIISQYKQKFVR
jgi:tripartite-type tricarboxylate transporter receptor subunit TctC